MLWVSTLFRTHIRTAYRNVRGMVARLNAYLQEQVVGIRLIQLFVRERASIEEFDELNQEHRDADLSAVKFDSHVFGGGGDGRFPDPGADSVGRRFPDSGRRADLRNAGSIHPVRRPFFPAGAGTVPALRHHAGGHGILGADFRTAGHRAGDRFIPAIKKKLQEGPRRDRVPRTSPSATTRTGRC